MPYKKNTKQETKRYLLLAAIILTALALVGATVFTVFAYKKSQEEKEAAALAALPRIVIPDSYFTPVSYDLMTVENSVKGITLRAGVDFYTDLESDEAKIKAEIDSAIAGVKKFDFNTVTLDLGYGENVIYRSSVFKSTKVDALKLLLDAAKLEDIGVNVIYGLQGIAPAYGEPIISQVAYDARDELISGIEELCRRYEFNGLLFDDYYLYNDGESYAEYVSYGSYGDFDEWLTGAVEAVFKDLKLATKQTKASLPVGIVLSNVYKNNNGAEGDIGSKTSADFQAAIDGHADTAAMIQNGLFEFANVDVKTPLVNEKEPFKAIVDFWGDICKKSVIPMYVTHCGEKLANSEFAGWNGTDELARQVSTGVKSGNYYGSFFTGLSRLNENPQGATDYLLKYFRDEIADDEMNSDLDISLPQKKSFVTYEESQQFRMKFDPNAEVFLNGEKVVPSERGGASVWVPLEVGPNKVVLSHKGRTTTYNIERKVIIFQSVSPTAAMKVGGGATIEVNAMAYRGSTVTATLNGQTITLKEGGGAGGDANSESVYVNYQGSFTAPKATAKDQSIGSIKFSGGYKGYPEAAQGSAITVEKLPEYAEPDSLTGTVLTHATVNTTYANTYDYMTSGGYAQAVLYQLPYGTQDIVVSRSGDYLHLRSGKTIHANSASLDDVAFEGNNAITAMSAGVEENDTVIRMTMNWKSPFSLTPSPYPTQAVEGKENFTFTGDKITLLMDYVAGMAEGASTDVSGSSVFSGMSVERVKNEARNIHQLKITLPLASSARYYGCSAVWEDNTLVLRFNQAPQGGDLSGLTIVVDPGHGGTDNGTMAGRDVLEKNVNLQQAEYVKQSLEARGAYVVMTRTSDITMSLEQRVEYAHQYKPDLLLSVHHNSAGSSSAPNGAQIYFNSPFSQPLAQRIQRQVNSIMPDNGWSKWHGYNFLIARERQFPSVLIESGFLSNPNDEALAQDPSHQYAFAEAVAQGVVDYYN